MRTDDIFNSINDVEMFYSPQLGLVDDVKRLYDGSVYGLDVITQDSLPIIDFFNVVYTASALLSDTGNNNEIIQFADMIYNGLKPGTDAPGFKTNNDEELYALIGAIVKDLSYSFPKREDHIKFWNALGKHCDQSNKAYKYYEYFVNNIGGTKNEI